MRLTHTGQPDRLLRHSSERAHRSVRTTKPPPCASTLLTIAEVLTELKVARSTFDTWRALGFAPECIKLPNGQIRVRRRALDAWLTSRTEISDVS
jgi:predicted DNA-binding transcriptional regulator AlpA